MAQYEMKLQKQYYDLTLSGEKRVEIRLNDEKRKNLKVGDSIIFENMETGGRLKVDVNKVCFFKSFKELFSVVDAKCFGCDINFLQEALKHIYGAKDEENGVLAIYMKNPCTV